MLLLEMINKKSELMRILITGANGYIGRFVVEYLLEHGNEVVAAYSPYRFDRRESGKKIFQPLRTSRR
jgi:nucleoside-diphosphate-sugar epimerase